MSLLVVTAMACEARPVVEHLGLKGDAAGDPPAPFRLYRRDDVALVVSGVGKAAAAAATAWAGGRLGGGDGAAFLNFGCAGHRHRATGEVLLAHAVKDRASGRRWFPPLVFDPPCPTAPVVTVDRVETAFEEEALYEMEASGFVETARRFTTAELVHCVKFVSDNTDEPVAGVEAGRIQELARGALEALLDVSSEVRRLSRILRESRRAPESLEDLAGRWRFSVTQGRQLRRLLERWQALTAGAALPTGCFTGVRSGRQAIAALELLVGREAEAPGSRR